MNQARIARCRATTRREFDFWTLMLATPTKDRTRAQRRHVQNRQKRNRLLALEVLVKRTPKAERTLPQALEKIDPTRFSGEEQEAAQAVFGP